MKNNDIKYIFIKYQCKFYYQIDFVKLILKYQAIFINSQITIELILK